MLESQKLMFFHNVRSTERQNELNINHEAFSFSTFGRCLHGMRFGVGGFELARESLHSIRGRTVCAQTMRRRSRCRSDYG